MSNQLSGPWKQLLNDEFDKPYFQSIRHSLITDIKAGKQIFPLPNLIFNAFEHCSIDDLKVVILGQDPYHSLSPTRDGGQIPHAHGLSFSIQKAAIKIPPSLQNIYKELQSDLGYGIPSHGNLESWAHQGVLLLNATLTVEAHEANSHKNFGWQTFTDAVIQKISQHKDHLVFILWGAFAQSKATLIDPQKHFIIQSPHPSPFSAHSGFFGSKPFSNTNNWLWLQDLPEITWKIDDL